MKTLVLAEKPSVATDLSRCLGSSPQRKTGYLEGDHYVFSWAVGHLLELKDPHEYDPRFKKWSFDDLPILPAPFEYRPSKSGADQLRVIGTLLKRQDIQQIVVATDAGREGELIARLILAHHKCSKPAYRLWTSDALTPQVVQREFGALPPLKQFDHIYLAAIGRQWADWTIGINGSRAYTLKSNEHGEVYSIGRVQTAVLALIVRRDLEIENFKPESYFQIRGTFKAEGGVYQGGWIDADDIDTECDEDEESKGKNAPRQEGAWIYDPAIAKKVLDRVRGAGQGVVKTIAKEKKKTLPPMLFNLSSLQQEANSKYGFTLDYTLELAQTLYQQHKAISYPRTESQHINPEYAPNIAETLRVLNSDSRPVVTFDLEMTSVSSHNKRVFDRSKLVEGHYALIPTGLVEKGPLSGDVLKLYTLIVTRFIAAFYPAMEYLATRIITQVGPDRFKTTGRLVTDPGWQAVYGRGEDEDDADGSYLPDVSKGERVLINDVLQEAKQTKPPSAYTDRTLVRDMENAQKFVTDDALKAILKETAGLGQPATRHEFPKTLLRRNYILRKGKLIRSTPKGRSLIAALDDEQIADPGYTAVWEQRLEQIAQGQHNIQTFLQDVQEYTRQIIERSKSASKKLDGGGSSQDASLGSCPECGKPVIEKQKNYGCTGYPQCKFSIWKNELERFGKRTVSVRVVKKMLGGKKVQITGLTSKGGKPFAAQGTLRRDDKYGWGIALTFDR